MPKTPLGVNREILRDAAEAALRRITAHLNAEAPIAHGSSLAESVSALTAIKEFGLPALRLDEQLAPLLKMAEKQMNRGDEWKEGDDEENDE